MSDISVDPATATRAAKRLAPAADLAGGSASDVLTMACAQNTGKWGTEQAPQAFSTRYSDALMDAYHDLRSLEDQLTSYVQTVQNAVTAFQGADGNAAANAAAKQEILDGRAEQQREDAAPAPTPQIPQAE